MGKTPGQRVDEAFASVKPRTYTDASQLPIASPWSTSDFVRFAWLDIFGTAAPANTRTEAMKLPPLARSVNLLKSTICRLPLRELDGQTVLPEQPAWITRTGDGSSPQLRNAWTVDDLVFYGWSCWWADRDSRSGELIAASRLNQDEWKINDDYRVEVDGSVVKPEQVIVFPGLHEGILSYGVDAIEDTRALYRIVKARLLNPAPQVDLHQTEGEPLSEPAIDALIERWAAARQGTNGGVGYSSPSIDVRELGGSADAQLMIEARNAAAVDLARLVGVTASRVDASGAGASLTYETTTGRNQELVDFDLALYMTPITARLSLDDVSAPGRRVDFDIADFTAQAPSVTGPNVRD